MKKISLIQTLVSKLVFSLGISFALRNKLQTYAFCCFAFTNEYEWSRNERIVTSTALETHINSKINSIWMRMSNIEMIFQKLVKQSISPMN